MIWDARVWSFFVWFVATALFLCGYCTPYDMPGNRINIKVSFAGDIKQDKNFTGLWGKVPQELAGTFTAVRVILSVVLILDVLAVILYVFLFRISGSIIQILSCVDNVTAGILTIVAIAIFRGASNELGEGFWFVASSSGLYILNGIALVLMPWMDYQPPKWKIEEAVPLTHIRKEEKV